MENDDLKSLLIKDLLRIRNMDGFSQSNANLSILKGIIISKTFRTLFLYRLSRKQDLKGRKILKKIISYLNLFLSNIEIPYSVKSGGGLCFPHARCIVIHENTIIGENVTIFQGVTIGETFKRKNGRSSAIIENNVLIGAGAKILGPITIGKNSMIGANAVVTKDIPKNSIAVGIPAKVIKEVNKSYFEHERESREIKKNKQI